jgi:hypothetical protein
MKLNQMMSGACAAVVVASLLGCSSSSRAPMTAQSEAALDGRVATTQLMSAQLAAPAPKVGKSHLVVDDEETAPAPRSNELGAPKDGRPSDGSRCSGHFGSTK